MDEGISNIEGLHNILDEAIRMMDLELIKSCLESPDEI